MRSFYKLKRLRALLDKTKLGEWVTIGQPMRRSLALQPPPVLTFAALQMVLPSTAGGCSSINALAGDVLLSLQHIECLVD